MKKTPTITVGELKEKLSNFSDDTELSFSGLEFYRLKIRGDKLVQIEFNQPVYLNDKGYVVVENPE